MSGCRYKSLSVLWGSTTKTEYKKIYQVLNGADRGRWYVDVFGFTKTGMSQADVDDITTRISAKMIADLGVSPELLANYSDINYYVEAYTFTNWVKQNLTDIKQEIYNKESKVYETIDIDNIFDININNNPEEDESIFVKHKKEIQKETIKNDLNLAIYNYSRGTKSFNLPVPTENDLDMMISNISYMAFLQGIPCGLKTYNNYFIATSLESRLYANPAQFYYVGENIDFHRIYCKECANTKYTAYKSSEFQVRQVETFDGTLYYYPHDKQDKIDTLNDRVIENNYSETACYYCIINKANYAKTSDDKVIGQMTKAYTEAIARERYEQSVVLERTMIDDSQMPY